MAEPTPAVRVSTLELFFDLVFVFTITQLAETLADDLTLATLGNTLLILFVVKPMREAAIRNAAPAMQMAPAK